MKSVQQCNQKTMRELKKSRAYKSIPASRGKWKLRKKDLCKLLVRTTHQRKRRKKNTSRRKKKNSRRKKNASRRKNSRISRRRLSPVRTSSRTGRRTFPRKPAPLRPRRRQPTLQVYSNNLSWATQINVEQGSEREFVRHCRAKHPGMSAGPLRLPQISACTKTALREIPTLLGQNSKFDILMFQEVSSRAHAQFISDKLQVYKPMISSKKTGRNNIVLLTLFAQQYNPKIIKFFDISSGRPCQIIYLQKQKLVVINCHWPQPNQRDRVKRFTTQVTRYLQPYKNKINRIIIGGDFNSSSVDFRIFQYHFKNYSSIITCCCKSRASRPGDFILDSKGKPLSFKLPAKYDRSSTWAECDKRPKSDHYAVIAKLRAP